MPSQLLLLFCLLSLAGFAASQCWHDGRILQHGELLPFSGDNCFDQVCRCESWDRCRLEVERKVVRVKVKETTRRKRSAASTALIEARVKTLECKCVEDAEGSHDMNFFCATLQQPGRTVEANMIGCLDMNGQLRNPGQPVTIQTSRQETMQCECNASGHYVNCANLEELRDACKDAAGRRVPLGASYNQTVRVRNREVTLQCLCSKSDQETACTLIGA